MKAMVITSFGGPNVFKEDNVPEPEFGPTEVLVKVHATSVNPIDYKIRQSGSWAGVEPPAVIGYDVSGVVEEIGEAVSDFKVGDEVYYTPKIFGGQGSYAEYHVAQEAIVARKPSNISHIEAASIPLAGGVAWDTLIERGSLHPAETVLIHAGNGGVGSLAIQLAKATGAYVFTTCSNYDFDWVEKLGADRLIDYRAEDFVDVINTETGSEGVDLVLDPIGGDTLTKSIDAVKHFGRIVSIVASEGDFRKALSKNVTVHFFLLQRERYKLDAMRNLIEREKIKPVIDSVMDLKEVAKAHERLEKGKVKGKIVLKVVKD
ncbi:MAG: zinc-dependent alcohol dehydrogenase family protein [Promethearchaeota archaeon]